MLQQVVITDGPSKYDLLTKFGLKLSPKSFHEASRVSVEMTIVVKAPYENAEVSVVVNALEWEDGSGESWNFHGTFWHPTKGNGKIKGYYQTSNRKGSATVEY